jgi:hypothetical protein
VELAAGDRKGADGTLREMKALKILTETVVLEDGNAMESGVTVMTMIFSYGSKSFPAVGVSAFWSRKSRADAPYK